MENYTIKAPKVQFDNSTNEHKFIPNEFNTIDTGIPKILVERLEKILDDVDNICLTPILIIDDFNIKYKIIDRSSDKPVIKYSITISKEPQDE